MNEQTFAQRRQRLREALREQGLDALLISRAPNRYYLSGFELHDPQCNESAGRLVITADGQDWLATDARYRDAAARLWDRERICIYGQDTPRQLADLLARCGSRIGMEARAVSLEEARALQRHSRGRFALQGADGLVERLRCIKDAQELAALERSFALNHAMLRWLEGELHPGRSEQELAWAVEKYFREHGASELAFASIVATGPNAALPHAIPGDARLTENCPVLVDVGCRVDGYCSDQTRTFWVGADAPARFSRTLHLVQEAQRAALDMMCPGVRLCDVHAAAHAVFEKAGEAEHFTHGLGHGVGLETHEAPSLSPARKDMLEPGMVVTVEPGLYYPEWGGVRWEHTVLVEENGVRIL